MPKLSNADVETPTKNAIKRNVKKSGYKTEKEYMLRSLNVWDIEQQAKLRK